MHEYLVKDSKTGDILEAFDIEVPFGESPPETVTSPKLGLPARKNFGTVAFSIPAHMRAGTADEGSYSLAKKAFSGKSRRNRTSLRDVARTQLAQGK